MVAISRRDFVKYAGGGIAALVVGSKLSWVFQNVANAQVVQTLNFEIGDAIKQMVTHNSINNAECYFWIYKSVVPDLPPECPGPTIFALQGQSIEITLTNRLDEPHAFFIDGVVWDPAPGRYTGGPIAPGQTVVGSFVASVTGSHLYYDNLNAPVNRVMGLHGAFHVHPAAPAPGHKFTPYADPTPAVQQLFDDFGSAPHFPGLAWEEGDLNSVPPTPPFRTYVWLDHQASPVLFQEVGNLPAGQEMDPQQFVEAFLRDPVTPGPTNRRPQYFTINGQSGHFAHGNPAICPNLRVGEPCVVHIINAGLWTHSMHVHANHFYVTYVDGVVQENPLWLDTFEVEPLERVDYVLPYVRPPDVPNTRGIGLPDPPLTSVAQPALIPGSVPHPVWPPTEELSFSMPGFSLLPLPPGVVQLDPLLVPPLTGLAQDGLTPIDLGMQLSPMCFPMHDHSEPSQTAQGGNYNLGLIAGINFTGDRTLPGGGVVTFPNAPDMFPHNETGPAAPPFEH